MSYSYVKTVFPDFEYSSVYDDKLYNNVNETPLTKIEIAPYDNNSSNQTLMEIDTLSKIEHFQQADHEYKPKSINFNIPVINNKIPKYNNIDVNSVETFSEDQNHESYMNHVTNCSLCKEKLLKQWGIENEKLRNEEILELISYVMLGLFILILLDTLKKE